MPSPAFVTPPNQMPSPNPPPKGGFPWKWVLLGCLGISVLSVIVVSVVIIFFVKAVKKEINNHVTITENGPDGKPTVQLKNIGTENGTLTLGSVKIPDWMPTYPGVEVKNGSSLHTDKEAMDAYSFSTHDKPDAVGKFYGDKLKEDGFEATVNSGAQGAQTTNLVHATKKSEGYAVQVTSVNDGKGQTTVSVVAIKKMEKEDKVEKDE